MQEFMERHAVDRFAVIGHSMGGVVAKGVLDQLDVGDDLASWRVLIAISSPFAGIQTAQYAERLPRHPPAWDDLAGSSPFLAKVQQTRFPRKLAFYVFFGARSSRPILAALGNNDGVLTLDATVGSPLIGAARDVFGFYEDHVSILAAPLVFRRLEQVLGAELGG
jgi:pimeloyl-ACP methyl ester carboxylesterase